MNIRLWSVGLTSCCRSDSELELAAVARVSARDLTAPVKLSPVSCQERQQQQQQCVKLSAISAFALLRGARGHKAGVTNIDTASA
jgi:hypothetical protein